ncbi:MAG: DivIVA domain-containing protein [Microbacteriaceae bacterium]|jgi:DivIVA domain-containing protein|nr:DivIVA domain-containing protein [Microbacteriaceae bacterium]
MPLTPEDVVNKRFQPTKFREGYDQDEVDDFLDEIVIEMRRVTQENEDLRQRLLASEARLADLQRTPAGMVSQLSSAPVASAPVQVIDAASAFPEAIGDPAALDGNNTNNLLQLARKLHDEHVREGVAKKEALIAEGHATAARIVREAEAQQKADQIRLEQDKALIEHTISELRAFEREYRLKIKTFIESQLADLDTSNTAPTNTSTATSFLGLTEI